MYRRFKLASALLFSVVFSFAQDQPVTIRAGTALDGKGGVLKDVLIRVQDGRIIGIDPQDGPSDYDLGGLTVMPGWIDTHVHLTWHFGFDGRFVTKDESPGQDLLFAMENAYTTLMAGFTTVQSVGDLREKDLRDMMARGSLPGPRILTSLTAVTSASMTPDEISKFVTKMADSGADLIKIFASKSIRDGGGRTLSDEQIQAAIGTAKAHGLRTMVHAYGDDSITACVLAGCTAVEHGSLVSDGVLRLMAERGVYFDPNIGLVIQNYIDNKPRYLGIGNYTEAGFTQMEKAIPVNLDMFKRALKIKGLKIVFGTDAVAGAHGRNVEEAIYRVQKGGQDPMAVIISMTSLAAQSLNMDTRVGTLAPGMAADIVAVAGDPLKDITALRRTVFVMKEGMIFKNQANLGRSGIAGGILTPSSEDNNFRRE
jgi:imidazolonepropionase-like amidohydrolase